MTVLADKPRTKVEVLRDSVLGNSIHATCDISPGDVIMIDTPWISWHFSPNANPHRSDLDVVTALALDDPLLESTITTFLDGTLDSLDLGLLDGIFFPSRGSGVDVAVEFACPLFESLRGAHPVHERYSLIFEKLSLSSASTTMLGKFLLVCYANAHASLQPAHVECGLFRLASKMNHSCSPNSVFYFTSDGTLEFKAVRDIKNGEAVTCSYLDEMMLIAPAKQRSRYLYEKKFFECGCERCHWESMESVGPNCLTEGVRRYPLPLDENTQLELLAFLKAGGKYERTNALFHLASHYSLLLESLPPAVALISRLFLKLVAVSFLFWMRGVVDILEGVHPTLMARWIHHGFPSTLRIPLWTKWHSLVSPYPSQTTRKTISVEAVTEALVSQDLKQLELVVDVEAFIGILGGRIWDATKLAAKCGLLDTTSLKQDLHFMKLLRRGES